MGLSAGEWIFIVGMWAIAIICGFIATGSKPPTQDGKPKKEKVEQ